MGMEKETEKRIFCVDIGGSKLICGVLLSDGTVVDTVRTDYGEGYTVEDLFSWIKEGFLRLRGETCVACGAAIPGLCDPDSGTWLYSSFSGIGDIPIGSILHDITGLPVLCDNDVNVSALAERYFGVCRDTDDYLWMTVSNGIGGGLFLGGKLYRGARGMAGEVGHVIVEDDAARARLCGCGSMGCLEAMASGASIGAIYTERTGKRIAAKELAELARSGDEEARRVFAEAGAYIGKAAGHTANLLGLDTVVIGGGVSESFDLIEPSATKALKRYTFLRANPDVRILKSEPGRYAALKGCAALCLYGGAVT